MKITKEIRMLELLANCDGLTKLDAFHHSDTAINTTVSTIERKYGIKFTRLPVERPNNFGGKTRFIKYRLEGEQRELALDIVRRFKKPEPGLDPKN